MKNSELQEYEITSFVYRKKTLFPPCRTVVSCVINLAIEKLISQGASTLV